MIKAIILDYDGTIADSVDIKTQAFAELYKPYGIDISDKVVEYHLAHGGVSRFDKFEYFHKYFLNVCLNESEIEELANKFSNLVIDKVIKAPYIPGALEFISNYYNVYDMYISTATPTVEINKILYRKELQEYFIKVFGSPKSKIEHVTKIMDEYNYLSKEIIFIGDSDSDREAANENKINFIEVCNENNNQHKDFKMRNFHSLNDIINIINEGYSA